MSDKWKASNKQVRMNDLVSIVQTLEHILVCEKSHRDILKMTT